MATEEEQLQIMTYNIKYATEEDGENSWSKRKERLSNVIAKYHPGILGIQEARLEQLQFLEEQLEEYEYFGAGRDGEEKGLFNAIFYDSRKFELEEEKTFWLSETPEKPSVGWDAAFPRICTYGLFREREGGRKVWIFNTHFDHQGEKAVNESARLIIKTIKRVNTEKDPVLLLGDFNLTRGSAPIQYLAEQLADSRTRAQEVEGPEETFNAYEFHEPLIGRFDYIFVSEKVRVKKYAVLTDSQDQKYPSDHFPILLDINLE